MPKRTKGPAKCRWMHTCAHTTCMHTHIWHNYTHAHEFDYLEKCTWMHTCAHTTCTHHTFFITTHTHMNLIILHEIVSMNSRTRLCGHWFVFDLVLCISVKFVCVYVWCKFRWHCACAWVHACACTCVYLYAYVSMCMCACLCVHARVIVCAYVCVFARMSVRVCMWVLICCLYVGVYVRVRVTASGAEENSKGSLDEQVVLSSCFCTPHHSVYFCMYFHNKALSFT